MSLEIIGLHKFFGESKAVNGLNLLLNKGEVLGLLGRNGAGKTTTIKMLLGLLSPDQGEIIWEGKPFNPSKVSIGYLPEERGLYGKSKIAHQLRFYGNLEGMNRETIEKQIDYWLDRLEISEYKYKKASELSKGNQQKVQLISALLHNPEFIILDEPFSGLDPVNANIFTDIIEEQIEAGKTLILSSHRMEQIEKFCQQVCILNKGQIVLQGTLDQIKMNYSYRTLSFTASPEIEKMLRKMKISYYKKNKDVEVKVETQNDAMRLLNQLHEHFISFRNFKLQEPSLNEIFIEKVK